MSESADKQFEPSTNAAAPAICRAIENKKSDLPNAVRVFLTLRDYLDANRQRGFWFGDHPNFFVMPELVQPAINCATRSY